jgi:hypothetical protein
MPCLTAFQTPHGREYLDRKANHGRAIWAMAVVNEWLDWLRHQDLQSVSTR